MSAFSALDMLFMSSNDQTILSCLTRKPRLTLRALADATKLPLDVLTQDVARLVKETRVVEEEHQGESTYSVSFSNTKTRIRNSPLNSLDLFS